MIVEGWTSRSSSNNKPPTTTTTTKGKRTLTRLNLHIYVIYMWRSGNNSPYIYETRKSLQPLQST